MPRFNVTFSYSALFDAENKQEAMVKMNNIMRDPIGKLYEQEYKVEKLVNKKGKNEWVKV
jgi:hypothetical protein